MAKTKLTRKERKRHRALDRAAVDAQTNPKVTAIQGGKRGLAQPSPEAVSWSKRKGVALHEAKEVFAIPRPPKGVVPEASAKGVFLAMDSQSQEISVWAAGTYASGWFDGPLFIGYPALALFAALPEYRRMAEVLATECTRKWIRLGAVDSDDKSKLDRINQLNTELERIDIRGAFRRLIELDAFFGRAHLFIDVGTDPDNRDELQQSIGNGRNDTSKVKFQGRTGFLRGVKPIEPVWCYPAAYNATNPLKDDWYAPQIWYCQSQSVHVSRLMRFVGREMPDLLKPAYMFGGVSLSQLMKPYVDRWITVVQSVTDIIVSYSTSGIRTNLETLLKPTGGGMSLPERAELFANLRSNQGLMLLDKDTEEFFQFNTPLSELESLVSKFQEFLSSMSGEPVVKLLGIQPAGLNASSEGEITSWLDWVEAFREKFCAEHLTTIIDFAQLSLFGEVDPDIVWTWESLRSLDPQEETERRKVMAETDAVYSEIGVFDPSEIRARELADPESPYYGMDELTPDEAAGPEGAGLIDTEVAGEFPQLEPPAPGPGEEPPVGRLGGIKIDPQDETGQEDPRTARANGRTRPDPERVGGVRPNDTPERTGRSDNRARPQREGRQREREPAE